MLGRYYNLITLSNKVIYTNIKIKLKLCIFVSHRYLRISRNPIMLLDIIKHIVSKNNCIQTLLHKVVEPRFDIRTD